MRNCERFLLVVACGAAGLIASACSEDSVVQPQAVTTAGGGGGDVGLSENPDGGAVDGIVVKDGQVILPDGAVLTDGTATLADGGIILPDGQIVDKDGVVVKTDGLLWPDGTIIGPDGKPGFDGTISGDGLLWPDGTIIGPDGKPGSDTEVAQCQSDMELCNGKDDDCDGVVDDGVSCSDSNPCTQDFCGGSAGCKHTPAPFATACDLDGNACTQDHCLSGQCAPGGSPQCADADACTADGCDPKSGVCTHTPTTGACEDGNFCTTGDMCQGGCVAGPAKTCNDNNPCTLDTCLPSTGQCSASFYPWGTSCDDGTKCTYGDQCQNGVCAGKALNCDDKLLCTDDLCDPGQGCKHPAIDGIVCDDGLPCTTGDLCSGGACKAQGALGCDDGNPCTVDACATGACSHTASTGACDDGTLCTVGDSCASGVCLGKQASCDDANPCTTDSCDPKLGCVFLDNNVPCNDGNVCTTGDACTGGTCSGVAMGCDDGMACTKDSCDPALGGCNHAPQPVQCDDGDICTIDSCLTASGCKHELIPKCCGGSQCAANEECIVYPDNLVPFCAKTCNSGGDCPGSCCYMTYKVKHCLTKTYQAECCGTTEYWATDADPYKCGVGGKGECLNWPNLTKPYYPSKITGCAMACSSNQQCPGSCCALDTMGNQSCVLDGYQGFFCPNGP